MVELSDLTRASKCLVSKFTLHVFRAALHYGKSRPNTMRRSRMAWQVMLPQFTRSGLRGQFLMLAPITDTVLYFL